MAVSRREYIELIIAKVPDMHRRSESGVNTMRKFLRDSSWQKLRRLHRELEEFLARKPTTQ